MTATKKIRKKHGVRYYQFGEDLIPFSTNLAIFLHRNQRRESGGFFINHPEEVAKKFDEITKPGEYKDSGIAAAKLHDVAEKSKWVIVVDPFVSGTKRKRENLYLNDVFYEAGDYGKAICYIVNKLTEPDNPKNDPKIIESYVNNLFRIDPESRDDTGQLMKILDLYALAIKVPDWSCNTDPGETIDENAIKKEYYNSMKEQKLDKFFKDFGLAELKKYTFEQMMEIKKKYFDARKKENALNNIKIYIPKSEEILLAGLGTHNGKFDEGRAKDNPLFHYDKMRELFEVWRDNSFKILGKSYKTNNVPGYKKILGNAAALLY
jgi:hypothetical protein